MGCIPSGKLQAEILGHHAAADDPVASAATCLGLVTCGARLAELALAALKKNMILLEDVQHVCYGLFPNGDDPPKITERDPIRIYKNPIITISVISALGASRCSQHPPISCHLPSQRRFWGGKGGPMPKSGGWPGAAQWPGGQPVVPLTPRGDVGITRGFTIHACIIWAFKQIQTSGGIIIGNSLGIIGPH